VIPDATAVEYGSLTVVCCHPLQAIFAVVLVRHRNIVIKEGVNLDPNAINNDIEKNPAGVGGNAAATATSPRVIRTDLEVQKPLAPPVSV